MRKVRNKIALYMRLSLEDEGEGDESNSISNQRVLLRNFVAEKFADRVYKIRKFVDGGYRLGDDIQSKVLAFAFGLSAEIERNLIGQRTREALARKKAEGVILGRPKGRKFSHVKLSGKEEIIKDLREHGVPINEIARIYKVNRNTVSKFIRDKIIM